MSKSHIGTKIREARRAAGISQAALANALDITQPAISRMEADEFEASATQLVQIAKILDVPLDSLMPGVSDDSENYSRPLAKEILSDYSAPAGLHALASDKSLLEAMNITSEELDLLHALPLEGVSKDGYVQLLITIRVVGAGLRDKIVTD